MTTEGYICHQCGEFHEGPPLSYGSAAPAKWYAIPEKERKRRTHLSSDQCEIDGRDFYIIGTIDIRLIDVPGRFQWTVWVSLSKTNYDRACKLWHQRGREQEPPYFGWLSTSLTPYPETLNLKAQVHTRPVGIRPFVELEPTDHPLAVEQRNGITMERVREIAEYLIHQE
ncbi:MAG TPA: DUF2199 domain-containing protein [Anaerolineales bacterium]